MDTLLLYGSGCTVLGLATGICSKSSRVRLLIRRVVLFSVLVLAGSKGKYRLSGV
jgi:hypothetical protein